jgi:hypothetical protein
VEFVPEAFANFRFRVILHDDEAAYERP